MSRRSVLFLFPLVCGFCANRAPAQSEYQLEITAGQLFRMPLHVYDIMSEGLGPIRFGGGESPDQVLQRDLEYSGFFILSRGTTFDPANPAAGAPAGTRAVVSAVIMDSWGRSVVRGTLTDGATRSRIFESDYPLGNPPNRWAIHAFADEIVLHLTGERGVSQTRIAYVRDHGGTREIHVIDYDGANDRQLTRLGTIVLSPAWAPSGDRLAFTSFGGGARTVVGLGLLDGRYWTVSPSEGMNASPAWAPDGRHIAFTRSVDGNAEIYVAPSQGGNPSRLTFNPMIDTSPTFSPDGRFIAFTSDRTGQPQVYVMDREGGNTRRITFLGQQSDSPDWSPEGDRIAFVCLIDNVFDICTIRADGSDIRRLTAGEGMHENPRWAPDGRHLVYSKKSGGERRIWVMASDGSGKRALTGGNGDQYNPAWSPALSQ